MLRFFGRLFAGEDKPKQQTFHRTVKLLNLYQWYAMKSKSMEEFVKACQRDIDPDLMIQKDININAADYKALVIHHDYRYISIASDLSFAITRKEALNICRDILTLLRDPFEVMSLLQDLDNELAVRMRHEGLTCTAENQPQYLLTGYAYYLPGPPPANYQPMSKKKILDRLLLEREMSCGINREGYAAKFIGIVEASYSRPFVADGHLFTEDKQLSRILVHGSHTHRLLFDVICTAIKHKKLTLKAGGKDIAPAQLLELLVKASVLDPFSRGKKEATMWILIMDNLIEEAGCNYNHAQYQFKCRSPNAFNSLLLCFGADLGVPHLQQCLLDSHWKAVFKMVKRVQDAMPDELRAGIPADRLYSYCMEYMEKVSFDSRHYDARVPFALTRAEAYANPRYEPLSKDPEAGIVRVRPKLG